MLRNSEIAIRRSKASFPNDNTAAVALTETGQSAEQQSDFWKGVIIVANVVSITSTSIDIKVQVRDPLLDAWVDLPGAAFPQWVGAGRKVLTIYPGIAETANVSVSDVIGRRWRLVYTIVGAGATELDVSACYVP